MCAGRGVQPRRSNNVSLSIELPETNTSPTVYVMGTVGAFDGRCSQVGTELVCSLGRIRKNKSTIVSFDIALPDSAAPLDISVDASTSSNESNLGNNSDSASASASQLYYMVGVSAPVTMTNWHCTGQGLSSFFECEISPGSQSTHDADYNADGSITFSFPTTVTGVWQQAHARHPALPGLGQRTDHRGLRRRRRRRRLLRGADRLPRRTLGGVVRDLPELSPTHGVLFGEPLCAAEEHPHDV